MPSLIPEIVIGEKYLWSNTVTEDICPDCGRVSGLSRVGQGPQVVLIIGHVVTREWPQCGCTNFNSEGWYVGQTLDGYLALPYPELTPLEAEK